MKWLRELWETYGPPWMTEGLVVFFDPPEWVRRLLRKHPPRVTEEDFEALREIKAEADAIMKSNTERRRRLGLLLVPVLLLSGCTTLEIVYIPGVTWCPELCDQYTRPPINYPYMPSEIPEIEWRIDCPFTYGGAYDGSFYVPPCIYIGEGNYR